MLISSPYQRQFSKQRALATVGGNSPDYDLFNRRSEENRVKLSKSSMVRMNKVKMLFNDRSSTIEKGFNCSLTLPSVDRINTSLETVLGVGFAFPYATSTATSTLNLLTVATTTQSTIYTPFSNYVEDSRGVVTTYLTLNGTLVGAYSYQKGNESSTGKITFAHANYLGAPVIETDDKGDIVQMDITDVFGNYVQRDQRNDNAYHNKGYTGHEYDDVSGNLYAHSRYLSAPMHSFLSVDPMLYSLPQSYLTDPQQMNSYAYARNNPIVFSDPTGENIFSDAWNSVKDKAKDVFDSVVASVTGKITQTAQSIVNTAKTAARSASTVVNFASSGYFASAQSDYQARYYGWAGAQVGLGVASTVGTVYAGPERVISVESGKIALQYGVPISEQIGKTITVNSFSSLKTQLSKVATWGGGDGALHHIVMQMQSNIDRFGAEAIQSTDNLVLLPKAWHDPITRDQMSKFGDFSHYYQRAKTISIEQSFSEGLGFINKYKP